MFSFRVRKIICELSFLPGALNSIIIKTPPYLELFIMFFLLVPDSVWRINLDVPEEGRTVSMDDADDRWWEQTDLVKLILASNWLTSLSEDIVNLPALTVLDVRMIAI